MFNNEFRGPTTQTLRFVTPDRDVTLEFHCHVPTHEEMGMRGMLIVGRGSSPKTTAGHRLPSTIHPTTEQETRRLYKGLGVVISVDARAGRFVVDHEEIKGFMAPMVMSYQVNPAKLLQGIKPGDKVNFTIDADQRSIVEVVPIEN